MSSAAFIALISAAILAILVGRAVVIMRRESKITVRGTPPGDGDTVIHAEYSSGLSGHSTTYKIPQDPQAYARRFVPPQAKEPRK
ncbi:MAG: hypothetical protein AAGI10_00485 [Pseudomonadota bacterium]